MKIQSTTGLLRSLMTSALLLTPTVFASPASGEDHPYETDVERLPSFETGGSCLIRGATIHSALRPAFVGDVLVEKGRIVAIGQVRAPEGIQVIEAAGMHLAPGVVDCHSHMAIERGVNEGTVSISAEVTMKDVVDPDDISIYRALAGGVTTVRLLHGSANAIGGRDEVLKLKWHETEDALRFPDSQQGIKFALGENPKRSNWGGDGRFPATRLGVEVIYYRAFERAREYKAGWAEYERARRQGLDPAPPRRDIRLETLVGILDGEVKVHSHCYRADEILMLIRASEAFGIHIATLQHVLEGYKVAHEMAASGVAGSTFSDWWAYKVEAYDAIPQNASLMAEAGVLSSINSDSDEMVRRLYEEAAKSVRYAGMDRVAALQLVTLNPAKQLGIDRHVGSIEVGKDADMALLTGDPLSSLSRVEWTMVDGEIEFTRVDAFGLDADPPALADLVEEPHSLDGLDRSAPITALVGGTLHPVTSSAIQHGTLLMQDGRILALGVDVEIPAQAKIIDCKGMHVWPGMISLGSSAGLYEIGAVKATVDTGEIGGNQPDLRVAASVNADSAHLNVTRHNGITRVQPVPGGGGPIRGQSALMRLAGDNWEEMLTVDRDMLHLAFPRTSTRQRRRNPDAKPDSERETKQVKQLKELFEQAREYGDLLDSASKGVYPAPPYDSRLSALIPYVRGEKTVALYASNAQTILNALRFAKEEKLKAVLFEASEAWKVKDVLAREGVPVVLGPIWALPSSSYDPYDAPYANAAVLARAGVPFAIRTGDPENERNLAFHAATAAAFGLPAEEAVRAVTYYPARILGVEDELGSLAVGKIADVVVTSGHLLEIAEPVQHLFIDGVLVDHVNDKQTQLYQRYRKRLQRLQNVHAANAAAPRPSQK